jgi:hypothetical protein
VQVAATAASSAVLGNRKIGTNLLIQIMSIGTQKAATAACFAVLSKYA